MEEEHFVDKHRVELIQRVTNVAPILDELHFYNVINQENYDKIRAIHDSRETMRELLSGPLQSSGVRGKQIFYKILQRNEPHLIDDLKRTESKTVMDMKVLDTLQVNTMVDKKLLIEILNDLSSEEFEKFKSLIELEKDFPLISRSRLNVADMQETVELLVQTSSRDCVEVTKKVLKEMKRTDLVQRLSDISSRTKEKNLEHHPTLIQRVATMGAVRELLLETLTDLSDRELDKFRWFLQFNCLQKGLPCTSWMKLKWADRTQLVNVMMETYGQQSMEVIREVFIEMKRTDLVQKQPETSSGPKGSSVEDFVVKSPEGEKHSVDKQWPALIQKVETMTSVIELLLETLADLSDRELEDFKQALWFHLSFTRRHFHNPWLILMSTDMPDIVLIMVQEYGQQSVEVTKKVLKDINRPDLVQRLSDCSSGPKKKHFVDEQLSTLIQKVATMAAVKEMLSEILKDLSYQEFVKFKNFLQWTVFQNDLPDISLMLIDRAYSAEIVHLMLQNYGQLSVEVMKNIFRKMNRSDLVQRLSDPSSGPREEQSVDEHRPAQKVESSVKQILLEIMNDLSHEDIMKFKWLLQLTHFEKGLQQISLIQLEGADQADMVNLMVKIGGQQSLEVTMEVFMDMNRTDLAERLSHTNRELREKYLSSLPHKDETMTPAKEKLLETLEELCFGEIEQFKEVLQELQIKDLRRIPRVRIERADSKVDLVELMVEIYGQQSVEVTREVLKEMNRTDLVQTLSDTSSGSKGPSGSLEFQARGSIMDSSDWTKLEPEVNCTDADESPTYSLQSEAGKFECSVSNLRWVCKEKVSFKYQFCSWEEHMERMESLQYMPAGPLLDITVTAGKLNEVYLPHWICTDDSTILDKFAVLHIDACGDVVEDVSEVTSSHVKLSEPIFSPRAVLMKVGFPVKIKCNMLIYYKPNTTFLQLHVYLIPHDPALQQTMDKKKFSKGYKIIEKPHPDKYLKMQQGFILTADIDTAKISPPKLTLRYDSQDPNFYEVFIENPERNFNLSLSHSNTNKSEPVSEPVWACEIRKVDYPKSGNLEAVGSSSGATGGNTLAEEEHTVDKLSALVQKAATITMVGEKLLEMLRCLREEDFNDFKWFLQKRNLIPIDLPCIPWSKLEKADRKRVVDLIEQSYSQRAVEVSKALFKKINRNDLVKLF